ncbi:MAG: ABC transporter permease [Lachnospiraceae bacterium]|nr:ABC transporter permease [Lachnospiraceae bacterium]
MRKIVKICIVIVEILVIWELGSLLLQKACLPGPMESIQTCFGLLINGEMTRHIGASLKRIVLGTLWGTLVAVPVGMLMGYSKGVNRYVGSLFNFLYTVPKVVFLPVIIVLMGIGDLPKVFLIGLVLFFQETVVIRDSANSIPEEISRSMEAMGATSWQKMYHMVFPKCLPDVITSLRSSLGTSIALLFITENFASVSGLGYYITKSMDQRNYNQMYAAIIVLSVLGVVLYSFFGILEKKLCKWKLIECEKN